MNITKVSELLEAYRELLDDNYAECKVAGYTFEPSKVLEELDPTAFREGYLNYADAFNIDIDDLKDDI